MAINWKRLVAGILASATLVGSMLMLGSCGNETDKTPDVTRGENETVAADSSYATLEKTKFNRDFVIYMRSDVESPDFEIENITGDVLDDAIYDRNKIVSDDYGVNFVYYENSYNAINEDLKLQVDGGLDEYDLYVGHKESVIQCAQNNYLYDLASIDDMDLNAPWWDALCRENMTVDDKTYLITGDIFPSSMVITSCLTFNRKMFKDRNMTEPFALVDEGKWTMAEFSAMLADVTDDKNGDGKIVPEDDIYGLTTWMMDVPYSLFYGLGGMFCTINEDEQPELSYKNSDIVDRYEMIYDVIVTKQSYFITVESDYSKNYEVFSDGRALFCDITLGKITQFLLDMTDKYGIVPMPKFDTNQKQYLSFVNGATSLVMVSKTSSDVDFVGTILDAMGAYNKGSVTPTLFESVTALKAAQDPDSSRMVDKILENRVYDFAYFAALSISDIVRNQLIAKQPNVSSTLGREGAGSGRQLSKIMEKWNEAD